MLGRVRRRVANAGEVCAVFMILISLNLMDRAGQPAAKRK